MGYWVAIVARNAAAQLAGTIDSILHQRLMPKGVVIIDDGSSDATPSILATYERKHEKVIRVSRLPDRGYDIRRVPSNINLACKNATDSGFNDDFFMVSGDDCYYPRHYAETIISRMESHGNLVVASGLPYPTTPISREHSPSGSGRMICTRFWNDIGGIFPVQAGWESWLLYVASQRGFKVKLFTDLAYKHHRARGAGHQFVYWGAAMYTLGYHPLYALGRIGKNAFAPSFSPKRAVGMFRGFFQAKLDSTDAFLSPFEPSLRSFVRREQGQSIVRLVVSLV